MTAYYTVHTQGAVSNDLPINYGSPNILGIQDATDKPQEHAFILFPTRESDLVNAKKFRDFS